MFRRLIGCAAFAVMLVMAVPTAAHANLSRSEPFANASLNEAPSEIRLWFTEPLEPQFSRITLLDANGTTVATPPSAVDPADPYQMVLQPGELPDGVYTVSWRALSSADGHVTQGSYAFSIGVAAPDSAAGAVVNESAPVENVVVRWINLASASLLIGGIGFWLFVWKPLNARRLRVLTGVGWVMVGIALALILAMQTATAAESLSVEAVLQIVTSTNFGMLWLTRVALWLVIGGALLLSRSNERLLWVALICGAAMLLVHAMNSHASAAQDVPVAVVNDWLHLLASSLWFGGLAGFVVVLPRSNLTTTQTGELVAAFSNYARAAVAALVVTGLYSAWLYIGSVEALMGTAYGRALLVKSVLFAPLLVIAAVNLLLTRRALLAGKTRWNGWLRGLVGVEVTLLIGILAAAALMTAINPARGVQAMRTAVAAAPVTAEANPYFEMQSTDDVMVHLDIVPGTVGENTFAVTLIDLETGLVIDDASLLRLRFNNREVGGQSELRPELQENGVYEASGTNLSIPGDWRIRMTIQRPGEFDKVLDFEATIQPPSTPPPPVIDTSIPLSDRGAAALLAGYGLLAVGGFFGAQTRLRRLLSGTGVLTVALVIAGAVSMVTGAALVYGGSGSVTVRGAWARPAPAGATGAVYLTIDNTTDRLARVIGAETEMAARVELHRTEIEGEIARMQPLDTLEVPPGETLRISPPGTHLMLVDLQDDLVEGETFPLILTFEAGEVVMLDVRVQMIAPE